MTGQHGENERLTVVEIMEARQGFVMRLQEPREFMQPVGPVAVEDNVRINWDTLDNLCQRLERLVHKPGASKEDYEGCNRAIYDQLFGSISRETRGKIAALTTPLLISSRDFALVWELLHDGEEFWGLKYPLARQIRTDARPPILPVREFPRRCLVIANPEGEGELEAAEKQAEGLVRHLSNMGIDTLYLARNRATPEQVLIELSNGNYDILHYTGHVVKLDGQDQEVSADEPGDYAMVLAGGYLRRFEIENATRDIGIVFLNGCEAARSVESLATAFLRKGANLVVGSVFKVSAYGAQVLAEHFYDHVLAGERAGEALRKARLETREDPMTGNAWACFVMYGNPCCKIIGAILPKELQRNYDDNARRVMENCVRYAESAGLVSTPFLFAALLNGEDSNLRDELQVQGVATQDLLEMFDRAMAANDEQGEKALSLRVSPNIIRILEIAAATAGAENRKTIQEGDLLRGFVKQGGGAMGRLLIKYGADLNRIIDSQQDEPVVKWGLDRGKYTPESWKILKQTADIARECNHAIAGTPHLFMALLETPPLELCVFLDQQNQSAAKLLGILFGSLQVSPESGTALENITLSPNLAAILKPLEDECACITPECILKQFTSQGGGKMGRLLLDKFGLDLQEIDSELFHLNGDLDKRNLDFSARKVLSALQSIGCRMGWEILSTPHLFMGLCSHGQGLTTSTLEKLGVSPETIISAMEAQLSRPHGIQRAVLPLNKNVMSLRLRSILLKAETLARETGGNIDERCLLEAFLNSGGGETSIILQSAGVRLEELAQRLHNAPNSVDGRHGGTGE